MSSRVSWLLGTVAESLVVRKSPPGESDHRLGGTASATRRDEFGRLQCVIWMHNRVGLKATTDGDEGGMPN